MATTSSIVGGQRPFLALPKKAHTASQDQAGGGARVAIIII